MFGALVEGFTVLELLIERVGILLDIKLVVTEGLVVKISDGDSVVDETAVKKAVTEGYNVEEATVDNVDEPAIWSIE